MPNPKKKLPMDEAELSSLCRAYTKANVQKLGGYAMSDQVQPDIQLRAIAMLLDRGWGKPKQDNAHSHELKGEIRVTLRKMLDDE